VFNKKLIREIEKRILVHHHLYKTPIKGILWEEIFAQSVIATGGHSDWKPNNSHEAGKDQSVIIGDLDNLRISNKSGTYTISSNTLKISGSRTTTYPTLEEKIQYISDKKEDVYVCLATSSLKKDDNYYIFWFDTNILDYGNQTWVETIGKNGEHSGWKCECVGYKAWINKSLSDQLWTHINLKECGIEPICIEL
jgi:hypothetical protein